MELYLLRHAIAVERGQPGYEDDSQRPLTAEGRRKMKRCTRGIKALGLSFDCIVSSPYVRALATAGIVARELKLHQRLKFSEHLAPDGDAMALVKFLKRLPGSPRRLLLVGHEPCLSEFAGTLIGGQDSSSLQLKKGGLCKLTVEKFRHGRCAVLDWLLTPRQLALIR